MDPDRLCPACGYRYGEPNPVCCPECGALAVPWTMRWRPWFVRASLDLLAWGLPLLILAPIVANALWGSGGDPSVIALSGVTFRIALVPVTMCAAGVVILCLGAQHRRTTALILGGVLVALAAWVGGKDPARAWLAAGPSLSPMLSIATILAILAYWVGVLLAFVLSARLWELGRALGLPAGVPVAIASVLLALSMLMAMASDVYTAFRAPTVQPLMPFGGAPAGAGGVPVAGTLDGPALATAGAALALLWGVVLVLRARARWDIERFEPARPRA